MDENQGKGRNSLFVMNSSNGISLGSAWWGEAVEIFARELSKLERKKRI